MLIFLMRRGSTGMVTEGGGRLPAWGVHNEPPSAASNSPTLKSRSRICSGNWG